MIIAAKNYAEFCTIKKIDRIYNAHNFIGNMVFVDYLPENYKKPVNRPKNRFNIFEQRNYDFDALEQNILAN